jgi:hypothetical protein
MNWFYGRSQNAEVKLTPTLDSSGKVFGRLPRFIDTGLREPGTVEKQYFVKSGELYYVTGMRGFQLSTVPSYLVVRNAVTGETVSTVLPLNTADSIFGPSIVGVGSDDPSDTLYYLSYTRNSAYVEYRTSSDLVTWGMPVQVAGPVAGKVYYNTSVCYNSKLGKLVMAIESTNNNSEMSFVFMITGNDFLTWARIGTLKFGDPGYAACPVLDYRASTDSYYFAWLSFTGSEYQTRIGKIDGTMTTVSIAAYPILRSSGTDGTNASDLDFCEYNGEVLMNWCNGNQTTWGEGRLELYTGTMEQFFNHVDSMITMVTPVILDTITRKSLGEVTVSWISEISERILESTNMSDNPSVHMDIDLTEIFVKKLLEKNDNDDS